MEKGSKATKAPRVIFNRKTKKFTCAGSGIQTDRIYTVDGVPGGYLTPQVLLHNARRMIHNGQLPAGTDINAIASAVRVKFGLAQIPELPINANIPALYESSGDFRTWLEVPGAITAAEWEAAHPPRPRAKKEFAVPKTAGKKKPEPKNFSAKLNAGKYIIKPANSANAVQEITDMKKLIGTEARFYKMNALSVVHDQTTGVEYRYSTDPAAGKPNGFLENAHGPILVTASKKWKLNWE